MSHLITKKIENKTIVWFENSNQYLVLEDLAAEVINKRQKGEELKQIAATLENELQIPFEKAIDFIIDLDEKIIKPNLEPKPKVFSNKKNYTTPNHFEFEKFYAVNDKIIKVLFSNEFELSLIHPKFAHLEVAINSTIDFNFQIFNHGGHTYLLLNETLIGSWRLKDIHYFQGKFSMKLIECIYNKLEEKWMGVFHASAIGKNNQSILVLGDSGNGKSTSLSLLQAHGFHCIADDFVPIDDSKKVHAFPAGISIKKTSLDVLLPYYPELISSAEYHYKRLNKTVRYLPPSAIDYNNSSLCKALLFIKYNKEVDFEMKKISNISAFQKLIPDSWISQNPKNVSIFLDWFSSLPCYQLTYSDNKKMISKIGELFNHEL